MKISNYDNSAVDEYINSLKQRESENTRSIQIANRKSDLLITVIKVSIIPLVFSLCLLMLFVGIGSSRSYEQIKRNFVTIEENSIKSNLDPEPINVVTASKYPVENEEILDVNALIADIKHQSTEDLDIKNIGSETTISDYVIFKHQILQTGNIQKLTVGQKYLDINQNQPHTTWCYLTLKNNSGIRETVHLIKIEDGNRIDYQVGKNVLTKMRVTEGKLKKIKSKCAI
tara:strand:+ start:1609 stop:2295 length:687 start_codon:yes stop_codon:yes gene_type:complete